MVFPYMDHDLAGLLENPQFDGSPTQIKLYARQLLEGTHYLHAVRLRCFALLPWNVEQTRRTRSCIET